MGLAGVKSAVWCMNFTVPSSRGKLHISCLMPHFSTKEDIMNRKHPEGSPGYDLLPKKKRTNQGWRPLNELNFPWKGPIRKLCPLSQVKTSPHQRDIKTEWTPLRIKHTLWNTVVPLSALLDVLAGQEMPKLFTDFKSIRRLQKGLSSQVLHSKQPFSAVNGWWCFIRWCWSCLKVKEEGKKVNRLGKAHHPWQRPEMRR